MSIVRIGDGQGRRYSAEEIGAKAANLAHVAALGLPVPPAFVLPVSLCAAIVAGEPGARRELADGLAQGIGFLEAATGREFGSRRNPLLVSVRSGAARSMPGMLDTVLDVGCTPDAMHGLVRTTGHPRFAWDCRRRFLESYGSVVLGIDDAEFAKLRSNILRLNNADERSVDGEGLERLAGAYDALIEDQDQVIPETPMDQLMAAAQAVYRSWNSERARTYRRLEHLDDLRGTAVTVQAMVFGNRSTGSGAGVAFSRNPSTGAAAPVIDVLFCAQGEDVVSGRRNPEDEAAIARVAPGVDGELRDVLTRLEQEFRDVQDVEFTIENGTLWVLQTRSAKRTPQAALRLAIDFVHEGVLTPQKALSRLDGIDLNALSHTCVVGEGEAAAFGIGASAGIAVGRAAFDVERAQQFAASGEPAVLLRQETSTSDVAAFAASAGIVTAAGGRTAHAALVARQLGKPCVVGCTALAIDPAGRSAQFAGEPLKEGDWLTIDGETGAIYRGRREVAVERPEAQLAEVERWRAAASATAA